jgi:predicted peptidase
MKVFFLCWLAVLFARGAVFAQSTFEKHTFNAKYGTVLPYRLLKPAEITPGKKYPLVLFLHGSGERGTDNEAQLKHGVQQFTTPANTQKYPAFVVAPQCPPDHRWTDFQATEGPERFQLGEAPNATMLALLELIRSIEASYPIDPNRIYLTGLSMGAHGGYELLSRYASKFAAAALVCSFGDIRQTPNFARTPLWIFHGDEDEVVPEMYAQVMVNALREVKGKPKYTVYPGVGHDSWVPAFREEGLYRWLFKQRKKS